MGCPSPPSRGDYLIAGLHAINASRRVYYDIRRHPTVVPKEKSILQGNPTADQLMICEKELQILLESVKPGSEWPYAADTLGKNLEALQQGWLFFPSLAKDAS